jgi:hypothetical protein
MSNNEKKRMLHDIYLSGAGQNSEKINLKTKIPCEKL